MMNSSFFYLALFVVSFTVSCDSSKGGERGSLDIDTTGLSIRNQDSNPEMIDFSIKATASFVTDFYNFYLDSVYENRNIPFNQAPDHIQVRVGVYQLDSVYRDSLFRSWGYFSNGFLAQDLERLKKCNHLLEDEIFEFEPEPWYNIPGCEWQWYDNFIGGQGETVSKVRIDSSYYESNRWIHVVDVLIGEQTFQKLNVAVSHEKGDLRIDKIEAKPKF